MSSERRWTPSAPAASTTSVAGIDQEGCSHFWVLSFQLVENVQAFPRQRFQVAQGKIFFTELDVIDSGFCSLSDFVKQQAAALYGRLLKPKARNYEGSLAKLHNRTSHNSNLF
jgi:hypothetical protein